MAEVDIPGDGDSLSGGCELGARVRAFDWATWPAHASSALTGWGQAEDRQRTADAGFDDHLTEPADPGQIPQILEEVAARVHG